MNWDKAVKNKREYQHQWYIKNKEKRLLQTLAWQKAHRDKLNALQRLRARQNRELVIAGYGSVCECCKESNQRFLTIDHIFNDGYRDKQSTYKNPGTLHTWLIKQGFPKDRFRLLCFNCNCGRQWNNGICPHMKN